MEDNNSKDKTGDNSSKHQNSGEKSNGSNSGPCFRTREIFNEANKDKLGQKNKFPNGNK